MRIPSRRPISYGPFVYQLGWRALNAPKPGRHRHGPPSLRSWRRSNAPARHAGIGSAILPGRTTSRSRGVTAAQRTFNPLGEGASPSGSTISPGEEASESGWLQTSVMSGAIPLPGSIFFGVVAQTRQSGCPANSRPRVRSPSTPPLSMGRHVPFRGESRWQRDCEGCDSLPVHHFPVVALKPLVRETARHGDGQPERC